MKKLLIGITAIAGLFTLSSCGEEAVDYSAADFRLASTAIAEDLNIYRTSLNSDFLILNQIGEGLVRVDETDSVIGSAVVGNDGVATWTLDDGLASGATVSADGLTYTFTLREGIKWSNGDDITVDDFVWSFKNLADPNVGAPYASMVDYFVNGEEIRSYDKDDHSGTEFAWTSTLGQGYGVSKTDDGKLELKLEKPTPYFMQLLCFSAFQPVHKGNYEKVGHDAYGITAESMVYSGPFKIKEWDSEYGIYLVKNDMYWDKDTVKIDSLSLRKVDKSATMIQMYEKGDIDRVGLTGSDYKKYKDQNHEDLSVIDVTTNWYLTFNVNNPILANANIRKALSLAINRQTTADVFAPYIPSTYLVPEFVSYDHDADPSTPNIDYRDNDTAEKYTWSATKDADTAETGFANRGFAQLTAAQQAWQAGVDELQDAGILADGEGETTNVELSWTAFDAESWSSFLETIPFALNKINGLNVTFDKKPSGDLYDNYDLMVKSIAQENYAPLVYDTGWYGWGPDYPDPLTYLNLFLSTDTHNVSGFGSGVCELATDHDDYPYGTGAGEVPAMRAADCTELENLSDLFDTILLAAASGDWATAYDALSDKSAYHSKLDYYYQELARAENMLLDNFIFAPVARKSSGLLMDTNKITGLRQHKFGADYSYKWVEVK